MEIRIIVLSSGELRLDNRPADLAAVRETLDKADAASDVVLYHRENPQVEPSPSVLDLARSVMDLIVARKLRISISSQPDFSDYIDVFGQSHPRPEGTEPVRGEFDPAMPDVDLRPKPEDVFAEARRMAGGVVMVRPDRRVMLLPTLDVTPEIAKRAASLPAAIPRDRNCSIAVISSTGCPIFQLATPPSIPDANKAIPFLGLLIGWATVGHRVWVFEGHASALAAGFADADFLLVDSGMIGFLLPNWMAIARGAMRPDAKVFQMDRKTPRLVPLVPSAYPPGWRVSEPDGEASYANCLLVTLAKGSAGAVTLVPGEPVPSLAPLGNDPEELNWIAELPFRYESLDARKVIDILLKTAARGKVNPLQNEWILQAKLVAKAEPTLQSFVLKRELKWLKRVLHISKL